MDSVKARATTDILLCFEKRHDMRLRSVSKQQAIFTSLKSWVSFSLRSADDPLHPESVNALPNVVDFLRVLRFPPTGNINRVS